MYILDAGGDVVQTNDTEYGIACNDDACATPSFTSPYVSELPGIYLGPGPYYIVVDGYGSEEGSYTLDINMSSRQRNNYSVSLEGQNRTEYDLLGYNIYVDSLLQNSEPIESMSYTVAGLQNNVQYTFGVASVHEGPVGGNNYESEMITLQDTPIFLLGDVSGTVTDYNGAPLDSAIVSWNGVTDTTDENGYYTLHNLQPGPQTIHASRYGFGRQSACKCASSRSPCTIRFYPNPQTLVPLNLEAEFTDEEHIYLSWEAPGSSYDVAYYDDIFESPIGCGVGGCSFGVRFTPFLIQQN